MKGRSKELLDRSLAAIEIYNKPDFLYREEAFSVLAINGWELLLKAKWLADHGNKASSLYVMEPRTKKDGTKSKKCQIKETRSGNPFTHSLDFLAKKLVDAKAFDSNAWANIQALQEIRDSSVHFYNRSGAFPHDRRAVCRCVFSRTDPFCFSGGTGPRRHNIFAARGAKTLAGKNSLVRLRKNDLISKIGGLSALS